MRLYRDWSVIYGKIRGILGHVLILWVFPFGLVKGMASVMPFSLTSDAIQAPARFLLYRHSKDSIAPNMRGQREPYTVRPKRGLGIRVRRLLSGADVPSSDNLGFLSRIAI